MKRTYKEIMDHVEVTADMRRRILQNLRGAPAGGTVSPSAARRVLPLAACLAVLLAVGAAVVPRPGTEQPPEPPVLTAPDIVEAASLEELSRLVGFDVADISAPPFPAEEAVYTAYWGELAQVTWTGEGQCLTYRQSPGGGDNSGDYTVYAETLEREEDGNTVTLKGDGTAWSLAVWQSGDYACSLRFDPGTTEETCLEVWHQVRQDLEG